MINQSVQQARRISNMLGDAAEMCARNVAATDIASQIGPRPPREFNLWARIFRNQTNDAASYLL